MADDPQTLREEGQQEKPGEALRPPNVDARKCHAASSVCTFTVLLVSSVSRRRNTKPTYGGSEVLMQSLTFTPGEAFLASDSPTVPWTVVFEDEGVTGYFYACDRSQQGHDQSILDAMSTYSVSALAASDAKLARPTAERIATVVWSRDGLKAVLYLDGAAQALFDFGARRGYCRMNFPNFLGDESDVWNRSSHAWSDAALAEFEAALYA
jgi:hypothetical protein